jgi:hypothetical protein
MMRTPEVSRQGGRETRLLLVTIAISVGVLLLLARFRFPDDPTIRTAQSAPAPLERLAARAAYDELASIMADLERRIESRVTIVRTRSSDGATSMQIAPRLLPDRAVAVVHPGDTIIGAGSGGDVELISRELSSSLVVLRVPAVADSAVQIRQLPLRIGPRYLAVVEATAIGPAIKPFYVGRVEAFEDPHLGATLLSFAGLQRELPTGAAIFTLEGQFVGLVREGAGTLTVVPAETLQSIASNAQPAAPMRGDFGIEVDALTAALARGTGADRGVIVSHVRAAGPAAEALRTGDVVQSVDGAAIVNPVQFREIARSKAPGVTVAIAGIRKGTPFETSLVAADASTPATSADALGLVSRNVPGLGVEVVAIVEGSAAAQAGLQHGDLIVAIDGRSGIDAADLARRFRSAEPGAVFLLAIERGELHRVLPLEKR